MTHAPSACRRALQRGPVVACQPAKIMTKPVLSSPQDPFLTTRQAAERLGVTLRTVQLWTEAGKLPVARTVGGHRRIRTSDVQALQDSMGIKRLKPAPVLLTDDQISGLAIQAGQNQSSDGTGLYWSLARAVEAAVLAANGLGADHG